VTCCKFDCFGRGVPWQAWQNRKGELERWRIEDHEQVGKKVIKVYNHYDKQNVSSNINKEGKPKHRKEMKKRDGQFHHSFSLFGGCSFYSFII